ncbi:MAG: hypothetical protein GX929_00330 [Clostridiales bacterium]|nr:hypothetical protein [Clostridiales bacterium]
MGAVSELIGTAALTNVCGRSGAQTYYVDRYAHLLRYDVLIRGDAYFPNALLISI